MIKKCLITVRRRKEPVEVDEKRGRAVKLLRFGDVEGNGKGEPDLDIDLGDEWAGKLGDISSVQFVNHHVEEERKVYDPEAEWKEEEARLLALPPEKRAGDMVRFRMAWFMRSGMKEKEPPAKVLDEARKLAIAWFKKHPKVALVSPSVFEPLLLKAFGEKRGQSLAESKRIPVSTDEA